MLGRLLYAISRLSIRSLCFASHLPNPPLHPGPWISSYITCGFFYLAAEVFDRSLDHVSIDHVLNSLLLPIDHGVVDARCVPSVIWSAASWTVNNRRPPALRN